MTTQERIMTIEEAAAALGVSKHTIRLIYLNKGLFPNAKKVPIKDGSKVTRWDIPESDLIGFQRPKVGPPVGGGKSPDEKAAHRHITLEADVDRWLDKRQENEPGFKVSEFINGLIREVMSREEY